MYNAALRSAQEQSARAGVFRLLAGRHGRGLKRYHKRITTHLAPVFSFPRLQQDAEVVSTRAPCRHVRNCPYHLHPVGCTKVDFVLGKFGRNCLAVGCNEFNPSATPTWAILISPSPIGNDAPIGRERRLSSKRLRRWAEHCHIFEHINKTDGVRIEFPYATNTKYCPKMVDHVPVVQYALGDLQSLATSVLDWRGVPTARIRLCDGRGRRFGPRHFPVLARAPN